MLGESSEDEEIVKMSDKEKQEFLRDITSISNDDGETWTCAFCEMEKESTVEKHLFLQYGLVCPSCFDSAMGFDEEDEIKLVLQWLKEDDYTQKEAAFNIDPDRIVLGGDSAGASLSMGTALSFKEQLSGLLLIYG